MHTAHVMRRVRAEPPTVAPLCPVSSLHPDGLPADRGGEAEGVNEINMSTKLKNKTIVNEGAE